MPNERPWISLYPKNVPADIDLPEDAIIEQFRKIVQEKGDKPAIYYFENSLTFNEVDRLSNELAHVFQSMDVTHGDRIALFMQNIPQFLITQLAAWKIGAIVVPINVMYKEKELTYHLNDSGAKVLVIMESLYEQVAKHIVKDTAVEHVVTTSELDFILKGSRIPDLLSHSKKITSLKETDLLTLCARFANRSDPKVAVSTDDIAYLVYTSGTTGPAKGAIITHKNVAFNAKYLTVSREVKTDEVSIAMAPLFHITGLITNLAFSIQAGIPVILTYRFEAGEMLKQIEQWKGTTGVAASTAYTAMINHPDIKKRDLSSFERVYTGGAPVTQATVNQYEEATGQYIRNGYGLTESTSPLVSVPPEKRAPIDPEFGTLAVGIPISNTYCKIVDVDTKEDLPIGEIGEIAIKGPQVFAGYWENEEETKASFHDGWFLTGDVGRMDEEGWVYVIERIKDMIIASGFKVWPAEVEDVLFRHPAVREAAVIGAPDEYRGQTVKAFISLREGFVAGEPLQAEITQFSKEHLANYKYPREIEFVDEIPKNPTGKFLRRLLR